jgi:hypothetical protein
MTDRPRSGLVIDPESIFITENGRAAADVIADDGNI